MPAIETFENLININPIILILVFAVIFSLDYCNPLGSVCFAFSEYVCMVIGYCIVSGFLSLFLSDRNTDMLINLVLLISIVFVSLKKVIDLFIYDNPSCRTLQNYMIEYSKKPAKTKMYYSIPY